MFMGLVKAAMEFAEGKTRQPQTVVVDALR
jgi:hypothetical protein